MSELTAILTDTVARLCADLVDRSVLEAAEAGLWPERLWAALEEAGLPALPVPEEAGGTGAGWQEAQAVAFQTGRAAAPVPLVETMLANWLLARAGIDLPGGVLTVAPVRLGERLRLRPSGLSGQVSRVPWGTVAAGLVAVAQGEEGTRVVLVSPQDADALEDRNPAREPRDTLVFEDAAVIAEAPLPPGVPDDVILQLGAFLRAAQIAGGLDRLLADSVRYAGERRQFGQPIGKFQAIQQQLAVLAGQAAAAQVAVSAAARALDRSPGTWGGNRDPGFEIAAAKTRASEAATAAAGIAHQTHGAIGFTYEHHLHFFTRRLWSWRAEFGNQAVWATALGRLALGRGADGLWPLLTER